MAMLHSIAPMLFISLLIQLQSRHKLASPMPGDPQILQQSVVIAALLILDSLFLRILSMSALLDRPMTRSVSFPAMLIVEVNVRCFSVAEQERLDRDQGFSR